MTARAIMFQGTGSDVGKSLLVAGLARAFHRRGHRVRPFKPQNMSNNAGVTADGGEIGRAQMLQARAAGVAPSVHMNPVLLKPEAESGAQIVVQGQVVGRAGARDYQAMKAQLLPGVLESFDLLAADADLILVEGAGSPAEINLRAGDIANMGFAQAARLPVILIGDIDRGGVIAQLVGTASILDPGDRGLLSGFLVNKFRGDPTLFDDGMALIAERTGLPALGLVPWFAEAHKLPAEDAVALERPGSTKLGETSIKVVVPRLSRIANFDDFDPLRAEADVSLEFIAPGCALPGDADLVVLPGSKATIADLDFFRQQGWDIDLQAHIRRGGRVLGICAGFQMLGRRISDPQGIEGAPNDIEGLCLLDLETTLAASKRLAEANGRDLRTGKSVRGYEMHMGRSTGHDLARPMLRLNGRPDGAVSSDGRVMGCYLHGLFAADRFRHAFLADIRARSGAAMAYEAEIDAVLDRLAEHLEAALDLDLIWQQAAQRLSQAQTNIQTMKRPAVWR